jgi:SAM-dependent methyltransferase
MKVWTMTRVYSTLRELGVKLRGRSGRKPRPRTAGEQAASYYDQVYDGSEEYRKHYSQSRYYFVWTVIVDRIRRDRLNRVLEVGCGSGQLAAFLIDQGVQKYVGLDFSATAIDMARDKELAHTEFVVGDARSSNVLDAPDFDVIVCTEVLEHITEDLLVVSRFPPGRRCICTVPSFPYVSHVRHFHDANQVAQRYGEYFDNLDVFTLGRPDSDGKYYLLDGIRNNKRLGE